MPDRHVQETLLHVGLQSPANNAPLLKECTITVTRLNRCYYYRDLHYLQLHLSSRPNFKAVNTPTYYIPQLSTGTENDRYIVEVSLIFGATPFGC